MSGPKKRPENKVILSTNDPDWHFEDPFQPQTPLGSSTPERASSPVGARLPKVAPWWRWAVEPAEAFKLLIAPIILYISWELFFPLIAPVLEVLVPAISQYLSDGRVPNPFGPIFLISHRVTSDPDDPRYAKGWCDLMFLAYNIVFFSCFRQLIMVNWSRPIAKYFGLKTEAKLDRFGEQIYAAVYFLLSGAWGFCMMRQLPAWWFRTEYFWIDYPHWDMKPQFKRYYLMQTAYWCQQFIVLVLGLEKPRKDLNNLVVHHVVTLWMIGGSYIMNATLLGNAVFLSMDIPDMCFSISKLLNYIRWKRAKVFSFAVFFCVWTYFRHYLSLRILWSVWTEFELIPEHTRQWAPVEGIYFVWWMKHQMFGALALLQALNLFWYYLIIRVAVRTIATSTTEDDRSDDEGDDEEDEEEPAEKK
ncbi:TLC domain-containing protein [Mycena rosella]|uniref:TLC domain-containing protein n=1 Tax=Mycena rosella TaxID=1033263 RepID=A0AAD7G7R5_MYCRO|nr:TLC domain-containing protein [Mycena rosella]